MRNLSREAQVILLTMFTLAFGLLCVSIASDGLPVVHLPASAALAALAALSVFYPVHIPSRKAYHSLGNVFCYAALFMLPLSWALLVCYARLPADIYRRKKRKARVPWRPPLWNASMIVVLSYIAVHILDRYGAKPPISPKSWLIFTLVAIGFEVVQILLVYTFVSLTDRKRWRDLGLTVTMEGFTVDVLQGHFGVALAVWWYDASLAIPLTILTLAGFYRVVKLSQDAAESSLDPKTQLHNARHLEKQLALAIDKSLKSGRPTSLLFADLDHLREINNTHGHQVGDMALAATAGVLRQASGTGFVASRFGGEEFILLLPNIDKSDAIKLAEELRAALESTACDLPSGEKISVTMSLGVATCPADGRTNYDLIRAADHAMYHAKAAGRNLVCWAGEA